MNKSYQMRQEQWLSACFGDPKKIDKAKLNHYFIEEAIELVQTLGCSQEDVLRIANYVFSRPVGEVKQEIGGVMSTLSSICNSYEIDLLNAADAELDRNWRDITKIQRKKAITDYHVEDKNNEI